MGKIHKKLRIGSKIEITNEDYGKPLYGKKCKVTHIATNEKQHRGYDSGMGGMALVDCKDVKTGKDVNSSFYEWEFDVLDD
jgi:hypothetical protein